MTTATLTSKQITPSRGREVTGPAGKPLLGNTLQFERDPHQCIGNQFALMEATLILATVAQRYRLRLPTGVMITPRPQATLRPAGGLPMLLEARSQE